MLGRFRGAITLDCVCDACNNTLSLIELTFGRDSVEGLYRFLFGAKDAGDSHQLGSSRVAARFIEAGDPLNGAKIRPRASASGGVEFETPVQVLIRHPDHPEPVAMFEHEITTDALAPLLKGSEVFITTTDATEVARLMGRLQQCGFIFDGEPQLEAVTPRTAPEFVLRTDAIVDENIRRVIAKIAFNYLAFIAGPEFVLQREFDRAV